MSITEKEFEQVLSTFTTEEQECIRAQRKELREMGITREPLLTEMACMFAGVILSSRKKGRGK